MATRTRRGSLEIKSTVDPDARLIVCDNQYCVQLIAVDAGHDQRVYLHLETQQLDELAAEILRIRDEHGI